MELNKKQRVIIIKKLSDKICNMKEADGILFLKEYTKQEAKDREEYTQQNTEGVDYRLYYNFNFSYNDILEFIQNLNNTTIYEMYKDLFPEDANKELSEKKPLYHLSTDKLVLFFSHSHKNIKLVNEVKAVLEKTDWIECFVAHDDIKEGKEDWVEEIKKYLECCHCLIAFLSKDFKSSNYCDQELGVAVQRQIPIFPVKLDNSINPYGFIQHIQAVTFNQNEDINILSNKIEEWLLDENENPKLYQMAYPKLQKAVETLKNNFLNSSNPLMAKSVLEQLMAFKPGQIDNYFISEIQKNCKQNSKIREVEDIEKKLENFFNQHLKKTNKSAKSPHQKDLLTNMDSNPESNLRKILEKEKEPISPLSIDSLTNFMPKY